MIDALSFHERKQFSYRVYIINLLDYFYQNRSDIIFDEIIIVVNKSQIKYFKKYTCKFTFKCFMFTNSISKYYIQSRLAISLDLDKNDLIISPGNYSSCIKGCKQLLVIHDLAFLHKNVMTNMFMRIQRKIFTYISINKVDGIIAISNFTRDEILNKYKQSTNKVHTIYNYFNFDKFDSEEVNNNLLYSYFISVSSSAPYKNLLTILKAFDIYCQQNGHLHLVLVGALDPSNKESYKYYQSLPSFVREKIHIYSHISDAHLGSLYKNASAFISATLYEGLGMPIVEAMYHGIPAILSDIPICREVSLNLAYYFKPYDFMRLKELMTMCEIGSFLKKDYSNQISQVYSSQNTVAKYIEIINSLYEE